MTIMRWPLRAAMGGLAFLVASVAHASEPCPTVADWRTRIVEHKPIMMPADMASAYWVELTGGKGHQGIEGALMVIMPQGVIMGPIFNGRICQYVAIQPERHKQVMQAIAGI